MIKDDYQIVPYTAQHHFLLSAKFGQAIGKAQDRNIYQTGGPGYTLLYQGEGVGCAGVIILWQGVGDAWAFLGPDARKHLRAIQFYTRRGLAMVCQEYRLRRVQAHVFKDFTAARRWAERFGFKVESEMPLAGPGGETLIRYTYFPQGE